MAQLLRKIKGISIISLQISGCKSLSERSASHHLYKVVCIFLVLCLFLLFLHLLNCVEPNGEIVPNLQLLYRNSHATLPIYFHQT